MPAVDGYVAVGTPIVPLAYIDNEQLGTHLGLPVYRQRVTAPALTDGTQVTQIAGTVSTGLTQPLTDTQLRANPVQVSGTVTSTPSGTQTVAGTVAVSNFPATQPVSGSVTVSGTATVTDVHDERSPSYSSGTGGGTVTLGAGVRLEAVSVYANAGDGTFTVAGGATITVRAGQSMTWNPRGKYLAAAVVMSASLDYLVEASA